MGWWILDIFPLIICSIIKNTPYCTIINKTLMKLGRRAHVTVRIKHTLLNLNKTLLASCMPLPMSPMFSNTTKREILQCQTSSDQLPSSSPRRQVSGYVLQPTTVAQVRGHGAYSLTRMTCPLMRQQRSRMPSALNLFFLLEKACINRR